MSTLAKVFIILNLVLAIGFAFITLTLYAKRTKFKDKFDGEVEAHSTTVTVKDKVISAKQKENTALVTERDELLRQIDDIVMR